MQWVFVTAPSNGKSKSHRGGTSLILPKSVQQILFQSSEKLAESCGYVGVATARFYEPHTELCTFLEVNSRLQVEHTITEAIMGIDLVQAQISIALGWQWEAHTCSQWTCH